MPNRFKVNRFSVDSKLVWEMRIRDIGCQHESTILEFDRCSGNTDAETAVKAKATITWDLLISRLRGLGLFATVTDLRSMASIQ